jgi:hypothetical protein
MFKVQLRVESRRYLESEATNFYGSPEEVGAALTEYLKVYNTADMGEDCAVTFCVQPEEAKVANLFAAVEAEELARQKAMFVTET